MCLENRDTNIGAQYQDYAKDSMNQMLGGVEVTKDYITTSPQLLKALKDFFRVRASLNMQLTVNFYMYCLH